MIKFVYFDVGGVLIKDFSETDKFNKMLSDFGLNKEQESLFLKLFLENSTSICKGNISCDEFLFKTKFDLKLNVSNDLDLCQEFVDRFEVNLDIHSFLEKISKEIKIGLLTNMYPNMLSKIKIKNLLPEINWGVVIDSSEVGYEKPEIEIFKLAEKFAGVAPNEILFVDNTKNHLEVAKKIGWQTYFFDSKNYSKSCLELNEYFARII